MTRSNVNAADLGVPEDDGTLYPHAENYAARGYKQGGNPRLSQQTACAPASGQIRAARGWQATVARALKVDRQKVNDVLNGRRTNARVAAAIAGATGMPASQLWPGKYKRLEYFEKVARYEAQKARPVPRADAAATGSQE
jgi:hypothetical protein